MRKKVLLLIGIGVLMIGTAFAGSGQKATPELVQKLKAAGDLKTYPDANSVIVFDSTTYHYKANGLYTNYQHSLVKILTNQGKKRNGEAHFPYFRKYDKITIEMARVIKPNGSVIPVPEDKITDITSGAAVAMNIYEPDMREKVVTFQGLEVGDAIEYRVTDESHQAPMENHFDAIEIFQGMSPIVERVFQITGPVEKPLHYIVKRGKVDFSKVEKNGKIIYTWKVKNVPRIIPEPGMPALPDVVTKLVASTTTSWKDISRWYFNLTEPRLALNDSIRTEVKQLIAGKTDWNQKALAIYHFVAQKVRYMGLSIGKKAGFQPHPVIQTYRMRYGVCKDVAALMVAMCREAGIKADIVLTNPSMQTDAEIPNINFNHAIVALQDSRGKFVYADPTVEDSPTLLPSTEADQAVLVATRDGQDLHYTPYSPPEDNMGTIHGISSLSKEGTLTGQIIFDTKGIYDLAFRGFSKRMPPMQLKMIWQQVLQGVYPGAKLVDFSMSDVNDLYKPFQMKLSYKIDRYAMKAGKYFLVKSPVATGGFELISRSIFRAASLPKRTYPLQIGTTFGSLEEEDMTLPDGVLVKAVPNSDKLDQKPIFYSVNYTVSKGAAGKNVVHFKKKLLLEKKILSPKEYLVLKKALQAKQKTGRGEIIFMAK